jgi:hypothetical protein
MADQAYDVLVVGASTGGVAAALRASAMGASVCLIDPTDWVGGQFTSQGVSKPDENKYIETVGSTASYREFKHLVRAWYRNNAHLSSVGASQPTLNPGGPYNAAQPQFAVEPKLGDTVLKQMIQAAPGLHWRPNTEVVQFELPGDEIGAVNTRGSDGSETRYVAKYVLDATDLGDCLPHVLRDGEWVVGAEGQDGSGEAGRPQNANPKWNQPIIVVCAIEYRPDNPNGTIAKPPNYERHRDEQAYKLADGGITAMFHGGMTMFNYRQYLDARNFNDAAYRYDRTTLNAHANDYGIKSIPTGDPAEDARIIQEARDASLGFLYWLQTECPRDPQDGGGTGYPELWPATTAFGTTDGMAPVAYIRESRRIKALKTILSQEVAKAGNPGPRAQLYDDSCGIGTYAMMDVHELPGQEMSGAWIPIWPAQIPMRALIPQRVTNLLAACKNLGTTHFTNGLYRLHPFEWNIGESAGALAAFCVAQNTTPHAVAASAHLIRAYQRALLGQGIPLYWWTDVMPGDPLWEAVQMVGATQVIEGDDDQMRFNPNDPVTDGVRTAIQQKTGTAVPAGIDSRGHLAAWIFAQGLHLTTATG